MELLGVTLVKIDHNLTVLQYNTAVLITQFVYFELPHGSSSYYEPTVIGQWLILRHFSIKGQISHVTPIFGLENSAGIRIIQLDLPCFAIANYFTLIAICVFAKQYSDDMAATTSSSDENANVGKTLNLF